MASAAKTVRVSDDAGANYFTLPGNSGEMTDENSQLVDTVFGQAFESNESGIQNWAVNANALYKGFAGYQVTLKKSGASTVMTAESMTLVSGKTFAIDDSVKEIWDIEAGSIDILDTAASVAAADIESIDYLNGQVTFDSSYTPSGAVTVTGHYLPTADVAKARTFTLNQTAAAIDETALEDAQANNGNRIHGYGLKTVGLTIEGIYATASAFRTLLTGRTLFILEIAPEGVLTGSYFRGFFKLTDRSQSGDVGALEDESLTFTLNVPQDDPTYPDKLLVPCKWIHPGGTTLNIAVVKILTAWEDSLDIDVQYLIDGTNGWEGTAVVTDVSLSGGIDSMNEFAANFMGDGEAVAVP